MEDKDSLYFSFDDEQADDEEGGVEEEAKAEEGQNRTFLIGAIALAAVFVLGICAVIAFIFLRPQLAATGDTSNIAATNAVVMTQAGQTAEALALTQSAPTDVPPTTAAPRGSATPTSGVSVTVVPGGSGTPGTSAPATTGTPGTAGPTNTPGGIIEVTGSGTNVAQANSPTPGGLGGAPGTPTVTPTRGNSGIIIVTPLGGGGVVSTPTRIAGQVDGSPTGVGGPIQPTTPGSLPNTGFSGGVGLAGAGLLAVVLVAVVMIARKMRMQ